MKKRRSIVSKVITLCFMLLLLACSRASEDNKEVQRDRKGRANDEIIVSMGARIPHEFDPKERYGMYNEAHITHSTLLRRTADLEIVGDFAKNYTVTDDGLVWTYD